MSNVRWNFALNSTNDLEGTNNAAITLFKGAGVIVSLAREVCQNSLDAKNRSLSDTPVKVKYSLAMLDRDQYPMFRELKEVIHNSYNYWSNSDLRTDSIMQSLAVYSNSLDHRKIPVLVMSDYNTTGLDKKYFNLLVNTNGISIKQNRNSGGSYGIGKAAPFAASGLNTVFYNTLSTDGWRALEGVAHMVSSQREYKGEMMPTSATGKYCNMVNDLKGLEIRPEDNCSLTSAEIFRRETPGTDVAVIGFKTEQYENWEDDLAIALISNFILAIKDGKLEVEIESEQKNLLISKNTLEDYLYRTYKDNPALNLTRQIYDTITKAEPRYVTIAEKDDLCIYVRYDDRYQQVLARFRSGMLINTQRSLPHYCVVAIVNDVGEMKLNETLKEAEPPLHNEWKSTHVDETHAQVRKDARTYIQRINKEIQNTLDEFDAADITDSVDAGIGNYLPDSSGAGSSESTDGLRTDVKISEILSHDGKVLYSNQYESAESSEGSETKLIAVQTGTKKHKTHRHKKIVVVNPDGEDTQQGVAPGQGKLRIASLNLSEHRIYNKVANKYCLYVNAPAQYDKVYIQFSAGRDDDKEDAINVKNVKLEGMPLIDVHGDKIGPISIKKGKNYLYVEFENHERMALIPAFTMEVTPNETQHD